MPSLPYMRWGGYIAPLFILVLLFVIPHDPSTSLSPDQVGSHGMMIGTPFLPRAFNMPRSVVRGTGPRSPSPSMPAIAADASWWGGFSRDQAGFSHLRRVVTLRRTLRSTHKEIERLIDDLSFCDAVTGISTDVSNAAGAVSRLLTPTSPGVEQKVAHPVAAVILSQSVSCNASALAAQTVDELRDLHGPRANWWGDLNARQTRLLYHELLPTELLHATELPVDERARAAVAARRAAKLYARERALVPLSLSCRLLDGMRHWSKGSGFLPDGLTEEQIWAKYADEMGLGVSEATAGGFHIDDTFFELVLRKSCTTNELVDKLVGFENDLAGFHP
uniref:Uncharacterized protein n=1 Tax=Coccolithus braarudii TaxID=221442 RepID=A0A7S0Q7W6_9EUKA